jgi:cytochrome P450
MARIATTDTHFGGLPDPGGRPRGAQLPPANRDPDAVPRPDRVVLDRSPNRHLSFGTGIHRCVVSRLARMELRVALNEWLTHIPTFRVTDPDAVTWTGGQVRGPRSVPVVVS